MALSKTISRSRRLVVPHVRRASRGRPEDPLGQRVGLVLTLLPKQSDWIPTALPNIIPELILDDADLPGEDGNQVTPYGRDGFATILDEELESDSGTDSGGLRLDR